MNNRMVMNLALAGLSVGIAAYKFWGSWDADHTEYRHCLRWVLLLCVLAILFLLLALNSLRTAADAQDPSEPPKS
jgi:hypothetical protein